MNQYLAKLIKDSSNYSYGLFCRNNPHANRIEKRAAITRFFNYFKKEPIKYKKKLS